MNADTLIKVLREAGNIERCHNVPHLMPASVGLHSYNAANIILLLHPDPSLKLIKAILWHDSPERFLGDLPAPAKWYNDRLAFEYTAAERCVAEHMGLTEELFQLSPEDQMWLHGADRLELLMYCKDDIAMGNQHTQRMHDNVLEWFRRNAELIPDPIASFILNNPTWERQPEDIR